MYLGHETEVVNKTGSFSYRRCIISLLLKKITLSNWGMILKVHFVIHSLILTIFLQNIQVSISVESIRVHKVWVQKISCKVICLAKIIAELMIYYVDIINIMHSDLCNSSIQ